jgi:hypothetical protein
VATATIRALLQDVAVALASPAPAGHPAENVSPCWSAVPESGTP